MLSGCSWECEMTNVLNPARHELVESIRQSKELAETGDAVDEPLLSMVLFHLRMAEEIANRKIITKEESHGELRT